MTGVLELSVVFLAITLGTAAILLVIRELRPQRSAYVSQQFSGSAAEVLPEDLLLPLTTPRGSGPIARFDAWFERMMAETDTRFTAISAVLCMLAAGLLLGGGLFVWREN